MNRHDEPKAGAGIREALRRQQERAASAPVSEDMEERIMQRLSPYPIMKARRTGSSRPWRVAASVAAVAAISVAAFGFRAWMIGGGTDASAGDTIAVHQKDNRAKGRQRKAVVTFEGARLDSILSVVASHYGRSVCFRDETLQRLRLHTKWDTRQPLAVFVDDMNELDDINMQDERDTLFVWKGGGK